MKLDIDCVRSVLLELETFPIGRYQVSSFKNSISQYGEENVLYTLVKLAEAKYINANYARTLDGRPCIDAVYDISFPGHQFLEKIKSDSVWNDNVKPVLAQVGTKSFDVIIQIASAVISSLVSKQLGVTV